MTGGRAGVPEIPGDAGSPPKYDVFLSHNGKDKEAVRGLAERLRNVGVRCWFDEWCIGAGEPFQAAIVRGLHESACCAILFGEHGRGGWHDLEAELAVKMRVDARGGGRRFDILPARLAGAPPWKDIELPPFVELHSWVDLARLDEHSVARFVAAVRRQPSPRAAVADGQAPYVGLRPLKTTEHAIFFGRDRYVIALVEAIHATSVPRWMTLLGASGSGKSSLLHAGLARHLDGTEAAAGAVRVIRARPGQNAWGNLRAAVLGDPSLAAHAGYESTQPETWLHEVVAAGLGSDPRVERVVVLVDQLEELFTSRPDDPRSAESYRKNVVEPFVRNLAYAARETSGRVMVVCAMRRDFFDEAADEPLLKELVADTARRLVLESMSLEELRYAVTQPAVVRNVAIEQGLVEAIVEDFRIQPAGALPFLQEAR